MSSSLRAALTLSCLALFAGCAAGAGDGDGGVGGNDDASTDQSDGGTAHDAGTRRDAGGGPTTCSSGQHACGAGCIDNLPNMPENGCKLGCGEPCPTPPDGSAACDADGQCTFDCPAPFHQDGTMCVCTPSTCDDIGYMCGAPDNGCGTPLDCGACADGGVCTDGACACPQDAQERNESSDAAAALGDLSDSPVSDVTFDMLTIDTADDEDWFSFQVADNLDCCTSTNPDITVTLDRIPDGSNYDLAAYYICSATRDNQTSCGSGAPDAMIGAGCSSSASGTTIETVLLNTECGGTTNENGTLLVHVHPTGFGGSCQPYRLHVHVE